jgi:hypothetical protein
MFDITNSKPIKPMKKLKIVLFSVLALGLTLTSCSDDDNSSNNTSGNLEGKWIYDKTGAVVEGHDLFIDYSHQEGCNKDYIEFVSGGNYKEVEYSGSECEMSTDETTWSRSGNTLTVGTGEDAMTGTIETLTATDLRIKTTQTFDGETETLIATFKRG